jgi:hypothetical protein
MRAILDCHPKVKCVNEIHLIAQFFDVFANYTIVSDKDLNIRNKIVEKASANFISTIITSQIAKTVDSLCVTRHIDTSPTQDQHKTDGF